MAAEDGRTGARLSERLLREPHRFRFFQAVRLLERFLHPRQSRDSRPQRLSVGEDHAPDREAVRFRTVASLGFPPSEIAHLHQPRPHPPGSDAALPPPEMSVPFLGLSGPNGALPYHYTALLLQRLRGKDDALRDFLDLFNHRLISLFYRTWEKYRLPITYERARLDHSNRDVGTRALFCLVGLGTAGLRDRLDIDDETILYYGGHFAHFPRSAIVLEGILADYFELPIRVLQAQGQWLNLERADQSRLASSRRLGGRHNRLGLDLVVGRRVWDVQGKFRLRVGPLTYAQYRTLMPGGASLRPLCQLARAYAGPELDFDVQPVLLAAEVPWCRLGNGTVGSQLGRNSWVHARPAPRDVVGPAFFVESA